MPNRPGACTCLDQAVRHPTLPTTQLTTPHPTELPLHALAINQLARLRAERGLTQQHVARAMGISQPRVSDIERAELGHTQLDTIRAYIDALGGRLQLLAHWGDQQ